MHSTSFFKRRLACAPPAGNTCDQTLLLLLGCAAAWGQAPTRKAKIKKKIYRQNARTRKYPWNRLPHSRDRPPQVQQGSGKHDPSGNPRTNAASPQKLTTNEEVHTNPSSSWQAAVM